MAFDGILTSALVHELSDALTDGRFAKIAQPEPDELLITVKAGHGAFRLLMSANASLPLLYLTDENKTSPVTAPNFCMLLRKHIGNARILSVTQPGLERIVDFTLEHLDEMGDLKIKHLIIELMGKHSNIIFTDDQGKILDAIKHVPPTVSSVRTVLPGQMYFIPDTRNKKNPLEETKEEFLALLDAKDTLAGSLQRHYTGFSSSAASELLYEAHLDPDAFIDSLNLPERERYADAFLEFIKKIRDKAFRLEIAYDGKLPQAFSAMGLPSYRDKGNVIVPFDSASALLARYYSERNIQTNMKQRTQDLRKVVQTHLERAVKKQGLQEKQLKDTEKRDQMRLYGELLNAYGYTLPEGQKSVTVLNYYTGEDLLIPMDPDLSVKDNAKRYFDRYTKQKRTYEALSGLILDTESEIQHLSSIAASLDMLTDPEDLIPIRQEMADSGYIRQQLQKNGKKLRSRSEPHHYLSSDGFDIYVGKNNLQNDELTFRFADGNDIWMHAKKAPGSHVIIRTMGKEVPDRTYEEGGALAAYYSTARDQNKVEVDYVERKQVKKPAGAKPGFVVYYTNYSLMAEPDISEIRKL